MDTRLPSLAELQNPVVDPLEDVKALIVAEVKAQRTKKIVLTVPRVLTQNEIHTLSWWTMQREWRLDAEPGTDSTKITLRGFVSIAAD
jgi:hypothetical protein